MRIIYDKLTKDIVTVIADDNSITAFPAGMGVIQGDDDVVKELAVALGLDVSQKPNFNMTQELQKVIKDRTFGNKIINEYLSENKALDLNAVDSIAQLQKFMSLKALLEVGAIGAALAALNQVETDAIFTDQRKTYYLNTLGNYINQPSS